jgi:hypothetical protein
MALSRSRDEDQHFLHPPIELASFRPHRPLHLDRRISLSAICFGTLLHLVVTEIHIRLEHADDSD